MDDVVQLALSKYRRLVEKDSELSRFRKLIENGQSSYDAAQKYSERSGQLAKEVILKVGNGDVETVQAILRPVLEMNYEDVIYVSAQAQTAAYKAVEVNLKVATVSYDDTYAQKIFSKLENYDDVVEGLESLNNDFISASQSYSDKVSRKSSEFMNNSGFEVLVTREYDNVGIHTTDKSGGEVCQWCLDRCGVDIPYDEAYDMGMFERHPGCGCVITYRTKRGVVIQGKGDWETNKWSRDESADRISMAEAMEHKAEYKENVSRELRKIIGARINDTEIKKISRHFYDQAYNRKMNPLDITDAIKNSLKIGDIKVNKNGKSSFQIIGKNATVYLDPDNGTITTVHKTHTKLAEKLMKRKDYENKT